MQKGCSHLKGDGNNAPMLMGPESKHDIFYNREGKKIKKNKMNKLMNVIMVY